MDYKYIEQLMERYWNGATTTEEEAILRAFFSQPDVPAHLAAFRDWFVYAQEQASLGLDEAFDRRLLAAIDSDAAAAPAVKARPLTLTRRLRPFYNAAAAVAVVMLVGLAAQRSFQKENNGWDYNSANYTDTYNNPQTALDETMQTLKAVQEGLRTAAADSTDNGRQTEKAFEK